MTVNVDPAILRQFSNVLSATGGAIREVDALAPFRESENAVQGSDFRAACAAAAAAAAGAVAALAGRAECVADIARGVAQNYEIADDELARRFAAMDQPK
ncbi:type VII secretion target [Rhodococcus sp. NPDC006774]|uniref:type VII secretion target n=1 Tax=Rhodococcus sp. NPDC006774 TaxID=3157186 RepID=UPI0033DF1E91